MRSILLLALSPCLALADWQAGVADVVITPPEPVWMSGYGSRDKPSQGVAQELHAKALALEDPHGRRMVIVAADLIGLSRQVAESVAAQAHRDFQLDRGRLLLTSSHTHTGPALARNLPLMQPADAAERAKVERYTDWLEQRLVGVIGSALEALAPAELSYHVGRATFAMNRREKTPEGVKLGVNPEGPVDHTVPVLKVAAPDGVLRAALFGYACHNTTLTGRHYELHGDYAGFAQEIFEKNHPEATALFMMGAGGDANPEPRGEIENARQNGHELADAVAAALGSEGVSVEGPLRAVFRRIPIELEAPPSREEWRKRAQSEDRFESGLARHFLGVLEREGRIETIYEYPLQVVRLGDAVTLIALGGEVTVGYALELKKALGEGAWVVAYANDVMSYIPTARILSEGGYEAERSQVYYGMPSQWKSSIEERIVSAATELAETLAADREPEPSPYERE